MGLALEHTCIQLSFLESVSDGCPTLFNLCLISRPKTYSTEGSLDVGFIRHPNFHVEATACSYAKADSSSMVNRSSNP